MRRRLRLPYPMLMALCLAMGTLGSAPASAADPVLNFDDPRQEALYNTLIEEYRCLKCQNQNLASSSAALAGDLRREVYDRVVAGTPREDIDTYLTERYGDFVLYRPPFKPVTWLLWIGPFVLLAIAVGYAVRLSRLPRVPSDDNPERMAEARRLLDRAER